MIMSAIQPISLNPPIPNYNLTHYIPLFASLVSPCRFKIAYLCSQNNHKHLSGCINLTLLKSWALNYFFADYWSLASSALALPYPPKPERWERKPKSNLTPATFSPISKGVANGNFKLNDSETYVLMYDLYTSGRYEYQTSTDLYHFDPNPKSFSKDFHPRHGTVISITQNELDALQKKWGQQP